MPRHPSCVRSTTDVRATGPLTGPWPRRSALDHHDLVRARRPPVPVRGGGARRCPPTTRTRPPVIERLNAAIERARVNVAAAEQTAERFARGKVEADRILAESNVVLEAVQLLMERLRKAPSIIGRPRDDEPPPR